MDYPAIVAEFGRHSEAGRTESRAFLAWFLEHYYRLDETGAEDCVCDGPDDKGIDGIYVDETAEVVYAFQAKLYQNNSKTLGDSTLREFSGSYGQLKTEEGVQSVAASTSNAELRGILDSDNVAAKIASGFRVVGVFITNVMIDENGKKFLAATSDLIVFDQGRLINDWLAPGDTDPVAHGVVLHLDALGHVEFKTAEATAYIVSLAATELVSLAGIENQALFAWNVRQALGRTKVNRAIGESIDTPGEHKNFMLYHNGITILAAEVEINLADDTIALDQYSVVNGAQSISTLYERRDKISPELRLLVRIIRLDPSSELAARITRNSNNQNTISPRDLQSNSTIQKRLKADFEKTYGNSIGYLIKRGEVSDAERSITNEEAARALLAFDLQQPWSCHQAYRYFDDLHSDIFGRPSATAARIVAIVAVRDAVFEALGDLKNRLAARYSVTPYFLMYLVRNALELDVVGRDFIASPDRFVAERGPEGVKSAVLPIARDLVVDLNASLDERADEGKPFDHKRELKSATAVRSLRTDIIPSYEKALKRGRTTSFADEWAKSAP